MSIVSESENILDYLWEQRNYFHSHPELGLQEFNTCLHIEEELNKLGIKNYRVAGTNVIAEIDSGRPGRTLFIRADIDANGKIIYLTRLYDPAVFADFVHFIDSKVN